MSDTPGPEYLRIFERLDLPFAGEFESSMLGDEFAAELQVASRLWVLTGYGQGIAAYLNFFLLVDFIHTHDTAFPPRFADFKSMAKSFYETDLFIRDVTDSGKKPTGGISSSDVRKGLKAIMQRHARIAIPVWMMVYFGFQLMEAVEHNCAPLTGLEKKRHLQYFAKVYRIMGIPFSEDRPLLERYARGIEAAHAGVSENTEKHARNILALGEMVSVSSSRASVLGMLPEATRAVYAPLHDKVRPGLLRRMFLRVAGRVLVKRAVGDLRETQPLRV